MSLCFGLILASNSTLTSVGSGGETEESQCSFLITLSHRSVTDKLKPSLALLLALFLFSPLTLGQEKSDAPKPRRQSVLCRTDCPWPLLKLPMQSLLAVSSTMEGMRGTHYCWAVARHRQNKPSSMPLCSLDKCWYSGWLNATATAHCTPSS